MKLTTLLPLAYGMTDTTGWTNKKIDTREVALQNNLSINYYLSELTNPDDATQVVYELHGNCAAKNVDYSAWAAGDKITCEMGFYYTENEVDWLNLEMEYAGSGTDDVNSWSCKDGISTTADDFKEDATSNCMANNEKSVSSFIDDKGTFLGHWMRSFDTMDTAEDILITYKSDLKANFKMVLPGPIEGKLDGASLCINMEECVDGAEDGMGSSGSKIVLS